MIESKDTKGKLGEEEGRKLFQQSIDGVSYCHEQGVYHRDLKPENVLIDTKGTIKISDFGLSALPQHRGNDGLLHTTCGSPNYIAPEVLTNRGYDGSMSDIWSCGVVLYMLLVGQLPFQDRNIVVLYQKILKGEAKIPAWLSAGAQNLLKRILDPNPRTQIDMQGIKLDDWFVQHYIPAVPYDEEEDISPGTSFPVKEEIAERKIRFTSCYPLKDLFAKMEETVTKMGFQVQRGSAKIKVMQYKKGSTRSCESFLVTAEVFEVGPSLYVVELQKSYGDPCLSRKLCRKLSDDFSTSKTEETLVKAQSCDPNIACFNAEKPPAAAS